ncbi:MAG: hypothetical protein LIO78_03830 [Clostridiales bacterium]|nr:hypothetical protein [Clostridiales bacterium]
MCTSFDTLNCDSSENKVYGSATQPTFHFDEAVAPAIAALEQQFPEEYKRYYAAYAADIQDAALAQREYLNNPMNYIGTKEQSDSAKFSRIRVGACDADTSFSISMALALKLANAGKPVDYALVWEKPHCEADYTRELYDWIESICN